MKHASRFAVDRPTPITGAVPKSQSNILESHLAHAVPLARKVRAREINASEFRMWFAPKFAAWLGENFGSAERVAIAFGVRHSTASNWLRGDNRASGDTVALAFLRFPDAVAWFLSEWEARR